MAIRAPDGANKLTDLMPVNGANCSMTRNGNLKLAAHSCKKLFNKFDEFHKTKQHKPSKQNLSNQTFPLQT